NNSGKLGINHAWSNRTLNIRSANTTDGLLRIEDSTGRKMLTHDATGKLQFVADTAIVGATVNSGSGSLNIQQRGDVGGTMTDIARMGIDGSGIQTWTNSGGWKINDADNVLRLQPYGGRVGIGTDSPIAAVNIVQKDTDSSIFQAENSAGTGFIRLNKLGRFGYNRTASSVSFLVKGHTGDNTIFRVENDAQTPLFRVNANGDVLLSGQIFEGSDRRLKKDIESLADVLPRVMNLRPTNYRYNRESSNSPTRIGFIAQEVETEFPTLINRSDSHLALNYEAFGVIAIKAIQEQQALIEAKDARISDLERRLLKQEQAEAAREARLSKLEQRLQRLVASAEDGSKKAQKVSNLTVAQAVR
ncbi:MAG: tail fiber domain-containing protein, partial [Limisphaerales bacterium]